MSEDYEHSEYYYDLDRNKEITLDLDLSPHLGPDKTNKWLTILTLLEVWRRQDPEGGKRLPLRDLRISLYFSRIQDSNTWLD